MSVTIVPAIKLVCIFWLIFSFFATQFCDFNRDPHDVSMVINQLEAVDTKHESFGE